MRKNIQQKCFYISNHSNNNNLYFHFRYGRERLKKDVATLRKMNEDITKECVLDVGDNSKLTGEFRLVKDR